MTTQTTPNEGEFQSTPKVIQNLQQIESESTFLLEKRERIQQFCKKVSPPCLLVAALPILIQYGFEDDFEIQISTALSVIGNPEVLEYAIKERDLTTIEMLFTRNGYFIPDHLFWNDICCALPRIPSIPDDRESTTNNPRMQNEFLMAAMNALTYEQIMEDHPDIEAELSTGRPIDALNRVINKSPMLLDMLDDLTISENPESSIRLYINEQRGSLAPNSYDI